MINQSVFLILSRLSLLCSLLPAIILSANDKTDIPVIEGNNPKFLRTSVDNLQGSTSPAREQKIKNVIGGVYSNNITLYFRNSPYLVESDLIIETEAVLTVETGVHIYFNPGVGITVKGTILFQHFDMRENALC
ncbi:unnamed protein product [Thelazia callipaeda]|uniref:DUF3060 domain-containing protein n=1 Tax=Thelazia callipaeda TaxID=103827 RepID=A0A0N5DC74_THECL|nr:unnamed protein product [Thelazia callipaeda]